LYLTIFILSKTITWENFNTNRIGLLNRFRALNRIVTGSKRFAPTLFQISYLGRLRHVDTLHNELFLLFWNKRASGRRGRRNQEPGSEPDSTSSGVHVKRRLPADVVDHESREREANDRSSVDSRERNGRQATALLWRRPVPPDSVDWRKGDSLGGNRELKFACLGRGKASKK